MVCLFKVDTNANIEQSTLLTNPVVLQHKDGETYTSNRTSVETSMQCRSDITSPTYKILTVVPFSGSLRCVATLHRLEPIPPDSLKVESGWCALGLPHPSLGVETQASFRSPSGETFHIHIGRIIT